MQVGPNSSDNANLGLSQPGQADSSADYWAAKDINQADWAGTIHPDDPTQSPGPLNEGQNMAAELFRKEQDYYNFYGSAGLFERDRRSYMSLYGLSPDGENVSYRVVRG